MVALGRLTYSVYLVHVSLITITTGYTRRPVNITNFSMVSAGSGPSGRAVLITRV